jgi:hypothetical protein
VTGTQEGLINGEEFSGSEVTPITAEQTKLQAAMDCPCCRFETASVRRLAKGRKVTHVDMLPRLDTVKNSVAIFTATALLIAAVLPSGRCCRLPPVRHSFKARHPWIPALFTGSRPPLRTLGLAAPSGDPARQLRNDC